MHKQTVTLTFQLEHSLSKSDLVAVTAQAHANAAAAFLGAQGQDGGYVRELAPADGPGAASK